MTQKSRFWEGTTTGDASEAPFDAATEFAQVLLAIAGASPLSDKSLVIDDDLGALAATNPTGTTVRISDGRAITYGNWYQNDADVDFAIPTPSVSTRIDRIVLEKDWTAQTVRLVRVAGAEGGSAPALTQTIGSVWQQRLWQVSITTGGSITLTDERVFLTSESWNTGQVSQTTPNGATTKFLVGASGTNTASKVRVTKNGLNKKIVSGAAGAGEVRFPSGGSDYGAVDFGTAPATGDEVIIEWAS